VGTSSTPRTHLFDHSTSIAGAAMAFGTNDSVASSSSAQVDVTNFAQARTPFLSEREQRNQQPILATTTTGGNTTFTLPTVRR